MGRKKEQPKSLVRAVTVEINWGEGVYQSSRQMSINWLPGQPLSFRWYAGHDDMTESELGKLALISTLVHGAATRIKETLDEMQKETQS